MPPMTGRKPAHLYKLYTKKLLSGSFCEILALNYAPGAADLGTAAPGAAAPGAWTIWSNILSQICSRSIFECKMLQEHIVNMLQEHI